MLKRTPAVFAVGENYQIMAQVTGNSLFRIEVGGKSYYDECNGIMRSLCKTHRVNVPMEVLDEARSYTVCELELIDRSPYFPKTEEPTRTEFEFRPVPNTSIRAYHIADSHNNAENAIRSARTFGSIDLLIMNGDIINHSGDTAYFDCIYEIAEQLTHGNIPIVYARGNHDLRGGHAEELAEYSPGDNGCPYYTFRLGRVWGLVLDCGEDKPDDCDEYGHTVACHGFRLRETEFIKNVIKNARNEYSAEGIDCRLIVSHHPFTYRPNPPFDIEQEIFTEWAKLIRENIKPDLMLCGHLHKIFDTPAGGSLDNYGQPCRLVVGSAHTEDYHVGCGLTFASGKETEVCFCDSRGRMLEPER